MAETVFIYGLLDPTTDEIRYVGRSRKLMERYRAHLSLYDMGAIPKPKHSWISSLKEQGLKPELVILQELERCFYYPFTDSRIKYEEDSHLRDAEHLWTSRLLAAGHRLLNQEQHAVQRNNEDEQTLQNARTRGRKLAEALDIEPRELLDD